MRRFSEMRWEIRQTTKEKIMGIFSMILSLLSGVALFLFGMSLMGDGLKMVAGNKLEAFLYRMTNTPLKGVALGTGVTSVIQSSSATTVMVIGFVNSGMMKLKQAIGIIMGANIGTSITGWILCLSYIEGSNGIAKILSSATIAAVVAVIGTIMRMICKRTTHKNIGNIMLGFAILMTGMQTMSGAVTPLRESKVFIDMLTMLFDMNMQMQAPTTEIIRGERLLNGAIRRMYTSRNFYPDANSTMRLSFGTVCGYTPFDGAEYDYYTTTKGVLEKVKAHVGDVDFAVQPEILSLLSSGNFGRYADEKGEMKVCFISNNDITGGNSGSAMFNSKGELLGLAFDGNWEAMGSDILYEPKMQRTIGVDVRYILFMIEKYGKAGNLIQELNILN